MLRNNDPAELQLCRVFHEMIMRTKDYRDLKRYLESYGPAKHPERWPYKRFNSARVGQASAGKPSSRCTSRTAARVPAPNMPSAPPTS